MAAPAYAMHPVFMVTAPLTIYFDGACPLCSREIEHYRKKDTEGRLHYVDIANSKFDAAALGLDPVAVKKLMHVRLSDGKIVTGVDAFIAIWNVLPGFEGLARLAEKPPLKLLLRAGYRAFAAIRPHLPKRQRRDCSDNSCAA